MRGNIAQLMQQAQKMQENLQRVQEEIAGIEVTGSAGGGMVTVVLTGRKECRKVRIDSSVLSDPEMAEDLVAAAFNDASNRVDAESQQRMGAATGDLAALLRGAGCTGVEESELSVAVDYTGFDEWWEPYTLGVSPAGRQLQALSAEQRSLVRERCVESMPAGPFTVTATAWAARGVAPR